jgi:hypothetical protein
MRGLIWRVGIVGLLLNLTPGLDFAQPARAQADASSQPDPVLAQAGGQTFTGRNFDELLTIYNWLLESPLSVAEQASLRVILINEFKANPTRIARNYAAIHVQLPQILGADPLLQARRRAEIWKSLIKGAPHDPGSAGVLKILSRNPSVLLVTDKGVVTQPEIDALVASDDNVATVVGLAKTTPTERARITRKIVADFPGFSENEDRYEAIADAEERCLSLRAFVESSAQNRATIIADIKAKVHDSSDVPREARTLENNALLLTRMGRYALQQKIISGVAAMYHGQINAIREAGDRYMWHESRAYQHGEPKPGANTGFGPN